MSLRQDQGSVALREQVVLDTLREHPWATTRMISDRILAETGGPPVLLTGSLWIPPWTLYSILVRLHRRGLVERCSFGKRTVLWRVREGAEDA